MVEDWVVACPDAHRENINYFDAPLLLAFIPRRIYFVATSAAFNVPVWAALLRLYGTISVERGKADAGMLKASVAPWSRPSARKKESTSWWRSARRRCGCTNSLPYS